MAKGPTITTIASGYYSRTALNDNFTNIDTAFDNTLSLDGSTPNAMTGDIDLGTNDLLNVGTINGATATGLSADLTAVAGISADITTVSGISANVTSVAADSADIGVVAGIAANVTTVAGISSDVTTVAADATDIGLVAGISTDVTTVATNLADVTNFSDVYLGAKASDPATRNDASALVAGDLYFNTVSDDMFVYSGSAWEAAYVSLSGAALTANNLSDLANAATARTNLGLGTAATTASTDYATAAQGTLADSALQPTGDGSSLTGIDAFKPTTVTGATPSLDVGTYNFFKQGALTANTTVSFASVPTNANWRYSFKPSSLSGEWDVSTATLLSNYNFLVDESNPSDVFFKPDGTKMYIAGDNGNDVNEYDLSTAWDVTTASYLQNFSIAAQESTLNGLFFKPDGTKMYIVGSSGDEVNEYDLSTAWNVTTAVFLQLKSVSAQDLDPRDIFFKPDGTKMYIVGRQTGDAVYEYNLSTAWNVTTASYLQLFSVTTQSTDPMGLFFKPDGTKMYISGITADSVFEYDLSTAWDVTTASYLQLLFVKVENNYPSSLFFKPDGAKMYIIGSGVFEYDLGIVSTVTLPAAVENVPSQALRVNTQVTYEFITADAGTTVTLISEEVT